MAWFVSQPPYLLEHSSHTFPHYFGQDFFKQPSNFISNQFKFLYTAYLQLAEYIMELANTASSSSVIPPYSSSSSAVPSPTVSV